MLMHLFVTTIYTQQPQRLKHMSTITYTIEIKWYIEGFEGYGFGSDKELYNLKNNRRKKQSYNGGSIGYWFDKKFVTLTKLRSLLYKPKNEHFLF